MPLLSQYARRKKIRYFLDGIPKQARILEIGSGSGWVGDHLRQHGWNHYIGIDLVPPADIVGNIHQWRALGLNPASFDVIIAFEVVEHIDCFEDCYDLLKPGGVLLLTTPLPHRDWILRILEALGLNQKRTTPHDHLIDLRIAPCFERKDVKVVAGLTQWATLTKEKA